MTARKQWKAAKARLACQRRQKKPRPCKLRCRNPILEPILNKAAELAKVGLRATCDGARRVGDLERKIAPVLLTGIEMIAAGYSRPPMDESKFEPASVIRLCQRATLSRLLRLPRLPRSHGRRPRYGFNHNAALFPYYPVVGGGGAGICLPPPPPLTDLNPPPPLASFAGSKSRTSFSRSVSVFEASFSSFIFRLSFCCCEPHPVSSSAHSCNLYYHGARHTNKNRLLPVRFPI